jgi:hypothetical protein
VLRALALTGVLAGCGRIGFEAPALATDAPNGDGPTLGFCAGRTTATFCRDFDEGQVFTDWTEMYSGYGTVTLDTSEARSQPASERVDTVTLTTGQNANASLHQTGLGPALATMATVELQLFVDVAGDQDAVVFQLVMDDGNRAHAIELVTRAPPGIAYIEDSDGPSGGSSTSYQSYGLVPLATGQWHHIELTYVSGASAQLDVCFDGGVVFSGPTMFTTGGQADAKLGISFISGPSTPWQAHFDDLAMTVQ